MDGSRSIVRLIAFLTVLMAAIAVTPVGGATAAEPPRQTGDGDAWIADAAEYLSGRALTVVCVAGADEWERRLAAVGFGTGVGEQYYGFSLVSRAEIYLSPYVCGGLRLGKNASTRRRNELRVAWSVSVLIHEAAHVGRSTTDEAQAEACARAGLPVALHRLFGVPYRSAELSRLTLAATWFRRTQGPAYQGGTCPAVSMSSWPAGVGSRRGS